MKTFAVSEVKDLLAVYGRSFFDEQENVLYTNWSASTVAMCFEGTALDVQLVADHSFEFEGPPMDPNAPRRPTWPVVAVFVDDNAEPVKVVKLEHKNQTVRLWESEAPETHRIRLTKLTENNKTFLGIAGFTMEGQLLQADKKGKKRLEIVGDSITCGYGNLVNDPGRHFWSAEEDGWNAYGPRAARKLGMEFSCISVSGITAVKHAGWMIGHSMDELYSYTDRIMEEKLGREPAAWDFEKNPNDYVVVNLGTNDCFGILFSPEQGELEAFPAAYEAFIRQIRRCNGPDTQIICALGNMNYYLYHEIAEVAKKLRQEGDEKLHLLRFKPIHPFDGLGADGHPAMPTHIKMAEELAAFIENIEK